MTCSRCNGRLMWEREDARDPLVLKCQVCGRYARPPREFEEPTREAAGRGYVPGSQANPGHPDAHLRRQRQQREYWQRKKAAGAA